MHSFAPKKSSCEKKFPIKKQPHKKRVSAVKEKSIEKHTSVLIPISSSLRKIYIYTEKERQSRARLHGRERRNKRVKEALLSLSFVVSGFGLDCTRGIIGIGKPKFNTIRASFTRII